MEYAAWFHNLDTRLFSEGKKNPKQNTPQPPQKLNPTNSIKIMMSE